MLGSGLISLFFLFFFLSFPLSRLSFELQKRHTQHNIFLYFHEVALGKAKASKAAQLMFPGISVLGMLWGELPSPQKEITSFSGGNNNVVVIASFLLKIASFLVKTASFMMEIALFLVEIASLLVVIASFLVEKALLLVEIVLILVEIASFLVVIASFLVQIALFFGGSSIVFWWK